ncbi:ATP-binding protein [Actinomadura verrucosospora]|uniref:Multidomain-containing protein family n=1 Tax=Actinomadura verrucosospora TaxID=46165 RepID=A0A7D3ZTB1_ACTVE|nr:LuxR C-terminal-related transcriptional regulator [Actinomadura verrucosospora]QKG27283.1 multidomain-containing protein family [Actinomadura verrucosospora]
MTRWQWARVGVRHEPTGFIGRKAELEAVRESVSRSRVVTLTGPGGVGKTRIALRAAHQLGAEFPDGVAIAELSGLRDAELLPNTVASAVGLPEVAAQQPMDQLLDHFAGKRALLVLDTCEHLVDAVAVFADILVHGSAGLVLLLTSRQPVALPGEFVLPVEPLPEPGAEASESTNDAVALLVARAQAACPSFTLSDDNRAEVVALCRRVDCMPLAIELAAVRLRTLSLEQILRRLDDRFQLLTGARSAQTRHQALRTTIEWSHDLCSPQEQQLWSRLSVFAGGFTLAAVEEVCAGGDLDGFDVIDLLLGLMDKSVVQRVNGVDEDRYRLLDALREFGAERLARDGTTAVYARRHLEFFLQMADQADRQWMGDQQTQWSERLAADLDNFRVALEHAIADPQDEAALRLVNGLSGLWQGKSRLTEARRWLDRAIAAAAEPTFEQGKALWSASYYGLLQADPAVTETVRRLRAVAEHLQDEFLRARASTAEAYEQLLWVDTRAALKQYEPVRAALAATGDRFTLIISYPQTAAGYNAVGDPHRALQEVEAGLRELESIPQERWARNHLLSMKVLCLCAMGELDAGRDLGRSILPSIVEQGETMCVAAVTEYLSWAACGNGEHDQAATLLGASVTLWRKVGALLWGAPGLIRRHTDVENALMIDLGADRFTQAYARGTGLSMPELLQTVAPASAAPPPPAPPVEDRGPLGALTERERQVAHLITEGLTNRQIAERLVISKRTADAHVEHILAKLGFNSRTQVATMIATHKQD